MPQREWPTREEWAKEHRKAYWDLETPHPYTAFRKLSDYASPEEIAAVIAALKNLWADYGRQMKAATERAGPLAQQRGEHLHDYFRRLHAMSEADEALMAPIATFRDRRREINKMIAELQLDGLPSRFRVQVKMSWMPPLFDAILARHEAAEQAGDEKWIAECAARPIDDAAWQKELERRAGIEAWRASLYGLKARTG